MHARLAGGPDQPPPRHRAAVTVPLVHCVEASFGAGHWTRSNLSTKASTSPRRVRCVRGHPEQTVVAHSRRRRTHFARRLFSRCSHGTEGDWSMRSSCSLQSWTRQVQYDLAAVGRCPGPPMQRPRRALAVDDLGGAFYRRFMSACFSPGSRTSVHTVLTPSSPSDRYRCWKERLSNSRGERASERWLRTNMRSGRCGHEARVAVARCVLGDFGVTLRRGPVGGGLCGLRERPDCKRSSCGRCHVISRNDGSSGSSFTKCA